MNKHVVDSKETKEQMNEDNFKLRISHLCDKRSQEVAYQS